MYSQETIIVGNRWRTNCYVLTSLGVALVIDPGDEGRFLAAHLAGREVCGTVSTHAHCDHIGAVEDIRRAYPGCVSMLHRDDRPMSEDPEASGFIEYPDRPGFVIKDWGRLLADGDEIAWGEDRLRVIHTPGHTPGSICLLDEANRRLFTGDTLFAGSIGRTDFLQGDPAAMRASLATLSRLPADLQVFPGHGPATSLAQELRTNPFLVRHGGRQLG